MYSDGLVGKACSGSCVTCHFALLLSCCHYLAPFNHNWICTVILDLFDSHGTMSTDKELYKLELLSLVSRVSQELFNHTKLQDKNLAEFVISVCPLVACS